MELHLQPISISSARSAFLARFSLFLTITFECLANVRYGKVVCYGFQYKQPVSLYK